MASLAGCLIHVHEVIEKAGGEVFRCNCEYSPAIETLNPRQQLKDRLTLSSLNILNEAIRIFNIHHSDLTRTVLSLMRPSAETY